MPEPTTFTVSSWQPSKTFEIGDTIMISGCVNREFGCSWPRWMGWVRLPEKARFTLQAWTLKYFKFKFGPQAFKITGVGVSTVTVKGRS